LLKDPVNLTWKDTNLNAVKNVFYSYGWDDALGMDEWVKDGGVWKRQNKQLEDGSYLGTRHNVRLWLLSNGDIVGQTHYERWIGYWHEVLSFEQTENHVADEFDPDWNVFEDSEDIDNECTEPVYNDGWLTVIYPGPSRS